MVVYYIRKMINAEKNYEFHNVELLAVVESFCDWCHYLKKPHHTVDLIADESNLRAFMTNHKLTKKKVR